MVPVNDLTRRIHPLREQLREAAQRVIDSGWFVLGECVREFERAFSNWCGVSNCVGVANGTDALELALRACGITAGSRVAAAANAGGYGTTAILACGATPVFVDVVRETMLLNPELIPAKGVDAILVTHLYGRMADMPAILRIGDTAGIPVIEDCAQAHGASIDGKRAGAWGKAGSFSFYPTKNLGAIGDGGAVTTNDRSVAERLGELRQYGWTEKYRTAIAGGRNSRLDELQAALLLEQLPFVDGWNRRRREIANLYSLELQSSDLLLPEPAADDYVAHLYVVRSRRRDTVRERLRSLGVATDIHYPVPDHRQQAWSDAAWAQVNLPETEAASDEVLTLPCFPELTDAEVAQVIAAVRQA